MFSLKDRGLVPNLATWVFVGTVVYPRGLWGKLQGGFAFSPMSLKVFSFKDTKLVPNLATSVFGGTVVYPREL